MSMEHGVRWCDCLQVMNAKKTADLIKVSFEVWTHGVFKNHLLDRLAKYKNLLTINAVSIVSQSSFYHD